MKTSTFIIFTILLSCSLSLKIRIPTPQTTSQVPNYPSNHVHSYNLIKSCDSITSQLSGADLLAYYSQDIYEGLANLFNELLMVRHEIQTMSGFANHRIIYQMTNSGGLKVYIALKIKVVGLQVNVVSYIQSSDFSEVIGMMGFPDNQMFSYPCGNLSGRCVQAFVRVAKKINVCQTAPVAPVNPIVQMPIVDSGNYGINHIPFKGKGHMKRKNMAKRKKRRKRRRQKRKQMQYDDSSLESFGNFEDHTPFQEVNANIQVHDQNGQTIHIGSARP